MDLIALLDIEQVLCASAHLRMAYETFFIKNEKATSDWIPLVRKYYSKDVQTVKLIHELCEESNIKIIKNNTVSILSKKHSKADFFLQELNNICEKVYIFSANERKYIYEILIKHDLLKYFNDILAFDECVTRPQYLINNNYVIIDSASPNMYKTVRLNVTDNYGQILSRHMKCNGFKNGYTEILDVHESIISDLEVDKAYLLNG